MEPWHAGPGGRDEGPRDGSDGARDHGSVGSAANTAADDKLPG